MDPEDYEDENTNDDDDGEDIPGLDGDDEERVIQVKVPKVPYNFEAIQRGSQSKSHLPINLPSSSEEDFKQDHGNFLENMEATTTKKPSISLQVLANFTQYCPPARARNLFWNWTLSVSSQLKN
jgi:hypothetical protein